MNNIKENFIDENILQRVKMVKGDWELFENNFFNNLEEKK